MPEFGTARIAPFVIRWGADASSDVMRQRLRCAVWARAALQVPSWAGSDVGEQPFPRIAL